MPPMARSRSPSSSREVAVTDSDRSPLEMVSAAATARLSGPVTDRVMVQAIAAPTPRLMVSMISSMALAVDSD